MLRRTKILATLGPATDKPGILESILAAGVNVVRINFSHGNEEEHLGRVKAVRTWAYNNNTYVGVLSDKKGINLRGGGLSADALTEKDKKDILTAAKANTDYVALSFPVNADDVRLTKKLLKEAGSEAGVISKIERAEVFDVANAVLDGTDAVMLSAETAAGDYPENAVKTMCDVCVEAEKNPIAKTSHHRLYENFTYIDETIAMSTMYAANHLGVKVIAALTESGKTPLWMSRMSSDISIYAISDSVVTLRKASLYRGVYPCGIENMSNSDWSKVNARVIKILIEKNIVGNEDLVILTKGMHKGESGGTSLMKILCVGDTEYE